MSTGVIHSKNIEYTMLKPPVFLIFKSITLDLVLIKNNLAIKYLYQIYHLHIYAMTDICK